MKAIVKSVLDQHAEAKVLLLGVFPRREKAEHKDRKTIKHPEIGDVTVDCDVLNDSDTDLKIVIYTAAPGSEDATKLDLARVAGISQDSPAG